MPDFEAGEDDVLEQHQPPDDPAAPVADDESPVDLEAPEADALEQRRPLRDGDEDLAAPGTRAGGLPVEANEADAAEQAREVGTDEDEYR